MMPDPAATQRLEAYLNQILAPFTPRLSPFQQSELRRELREHLRERVDTYRGLGQSEEEAVTETLRQFGGAEDFLREWQQEWIKITPQATLREIGIATRCALLLSLPALLIACIGSPVWLHTINVSQDDWAPGWMRSYDLVYVTSGWASFGLDFILLPLALGAAVGRFMPRYAGIGLLGALALEIALSDWVSMNPAAPNLGWFVRGFSWQGFYCSILWLPIAYTTAVLTGWWNQRHSGTYRVARGFTGGPSFGN